MNTAIRPVSRLRASVAALTALLLAFAGLSLSGLPASAAPSPATTTSSSLSWGFKLSWRGYIGLGGGVATASGGASKVDATPNSSYSWTAGEATFDAAKASGSAQFAGTVRFENTAHGIDLSVSNPRVDFADGAGSISWTGPTGDVVGATLTGVTASTPVVDGSTSSVTITSTAAAFTDAGGTPFTYGAGTAIDNVSFTLTYPTAAPAASTTTTLAAPATAVVGTSASLTATVAPSTAAGTVEFFDGTTSLGTSPVASGTSTMPATFAAAGAHQITAKFTPTDATAFVTSTSTAATVTVSSAPVVTTPTVTVSKTSITDAGEIITVTGSGFSPVGTTTNAARPPLAGKFGGVYVTFGKFADVWKASASAPSSARSADRSTLKWVVNPGDVAVVGGASAGAVAINADGTFSIDMLVKPGFSGEPATGNYGVYTYPGGGVAYAPFETYTPITFVPTPKVTVSKTTLTSAGETVTVTGSGFSPVGTTTNAARPPLAGKFGGVYVTFGKFADVWKASAGAPSSARSADRSTLKWVVNPGDVAAVGGASAGAVAINADGTFSITMLVKPGFSGEPATGNYGIYTYPGGGVSYANFETYTPITFAGTAPTATSTALTATPSAVTAGGSTTLTAQVSPSNAAGSVAFALGSTALGTVAVSSGTASLPVDGLAAGTQQFTATFVPADATTFAGSSATAAVSVAAQAVGAGSLSWGVKQSFRDYVSGPIAKGAITTSGVGSSGGSFVFGQAAGGSFDRASGVGTSNYSGSVRFSGHAGLLDVSLSNPVVRIDSATVGTLLVSVNGGSSTPFATLDLSAASRSTPDNTVSYSGVPAKLTAQGASVFALNGSGFYSVGEPLDAVSFVIGAPRAASSAIGATVASFTAPKTAAPTAPSTTGIELVQGNPDALVAGDEITVTASGFRPNETGILVVIYSTPTVLDKNATADATGAVSWTGRLPAGLSGQHTLTFQGSVDRGIELTIAPAAASAAVAGCVVDDATITWGFKESFRSYISGAIAKGEWTVADGATYAVPNFGWSAGTGGYDAESGEGLLAFAGSIAFTGHGGVLNTTVANPQIRFVDADSAVLLLDISGTTQDGAAVDNKAVEFAQLDLSGVVANDQGAVTITNAPATLTAEGAAAFGTYPAGEPLDPVSIAFSTAADCAQPADDEAAPMVTSTADGTVSSEKPADLGWIVWVLLPLLVIVAAVVVVVVLRRRKA